MKRFFWQCVSWLEIIASTVIGFPFKFWLLTKNKERLEEVWELRVLPHWRMYLFILWAQRSRPFQDENCGEINPWLYFGHWEGTCRLGHRHVGPVLGMSPAVMWWNFRNRKPVFNFFKKAAAMQLDALIDQMKNCGFQRRVPVAQPEQQEADPRLAGVTI